MGESVMTVAVPSHSSARAGLSVSLSSLPPSTLFASAGKFSRRCSCVAEYQPVARMGRSYRGSLRETGRTAGLSGSFHSGVELRSPSGSGDPA
jgi:hypothetical protein